MHEMHLPSRTSVHKQLLFSYCGCSGITLHLCCKHRLTVRRVCTFVGLWCQVQQDGDWDDRVRQAFASLDNNQDGVICDEDLLSSASSQV